MKRNWKSLLVLSFCVATEIGNARHFTRENYIDYMDGPKSILAQTKASARLHLFGNPAAEDYEDTDPVDGIDDRRGIRLQFIAAKFSPILYRNTFSVPRDFRPFFNDSARFLIVDTWELSGSVPTRVQSDSIDLMFFASNQPFSRPEAPESPAGDQALLALQQAFHPAQRRMKPIRPETHRRRVIFFDFPGTTESGWRKYHKNLLPASR